MSTWNALLKMVMRAIPRQKFLVASRDVVQREMRKSALQSRRNLRSWRSRNAQSMVGKFSILVLMVAQWVMLVLGIALFVFIHAASVVPFPS